MFGYVTPEKDELRVRELTRYRAYYCGLCRAIGQSYGEAARLFLNYDCVFAAILLSGLYREGDVCAPHRCAYKPLRKKEPVMPANEQLAAAADLNVILAWHKLGDDARDERSPKAAGGRLLLRTAHGKAREKRPELDEIIAEGLAQLAELETARCDALDAPADAFGGTLKRCFDYFSKDLDSIRPAMKALGYNLGKWIYLIDAWEDRARDAKRGNYNAFLASGADRERASFLLYYSLNEAIAAYELLRLASNAEILDNIMLTGCAARTQRALKGETTHGSV
ncbi:MAG TPA: DUF5685 family protein [Clostridia bacterium]|nr:DUF5685 family protein [Clostridia bacterium]